MKFNKQIAMMLAATALASCSQFDDINTNPDAATKVTSTLLATGSIIDITKPSQGKSFMSNQMLSKYIGWGENKEGNQYNSFGSEDFKKYIMLKDYKLMAELSAPENKNAYEALALFLKAYKLYDFTLNVGDIPYKGILEGEQGNLTPAYNTQKEVFTFLLEDLDRAHELFTIAAKEEGNFKGDPTAFAGKVSNWIKINTALELRILINLSKKESDPDLKVKEKFAQVAARANSLMASNDDNLQLKFSDKKGQIYPFNNTLHQHYSYPVVTSVIIDLLKANQDYRLFYYADPSSVKLKAGLKQDNWDAYPGVDPSLPYVEFGEFYESKNYCPLNRRYVTYIPGEPYIRVGYAEQKFILAEAALRGWISGDASTYYKEGIKASMDFVKDNTLNDEMYHHGRLITEEVITQLLANPTLQLTGDFEGDLKKIIEQKYIAGFMQLPYQSYYDYRRTGYPEFPINPESNNNSNAPDKMPVRWTYPSGEFSYNKANVEAALQRQFGSTSDDINAVMWILK